MGLVHLESLSARLDAESLIDFCLCLVTLYSEPEKAVPDKELKDFSRRCIGESNASVARYGVFAS